MRDILARWIVYTGHKYPCIESLFLGSSNCMSFGDFAADDRLEDPLAKAAAQTPDLKSYQVGFSSLTPNIIKAMDDNGIKLDTIEMCVYDENYLNQQLRLLKRSHQSENVSTMSILYRWGCFSGDLFWVRNTSLDNHYEKLVNLTIKAAYSDLTVLLDILENAPPTLESVDFASIVFSSLLERPSRAVLCPKLKELILRADLEEETILEEWNEGFKWILNACPGLEIFDFLSDGSNSMRLVLSLLIFLDSKSCKR